MLLNLEACLLLSELSGLAQGLELGGEIGVVCIASVTSACWIPGLPKLVGQIRGTERSLGGLCVTEGVICALQWQIEEKY